MATQRQALEREQRGESQGESPRERPRPAGGQDGNGSRQGALQNVNPERLAYGLGWVSIGLGLAELLTPRGVAKVAGVRGRHTGFIRLMGLREIAHGIAIFSQGRRPAGAVWSRVVGDALDLAALGAAFASPDSDKGRVAFATANVLALTALDVLCAQQLGSEEGTTTGGTKQVRNSIIINRPPEELYQFWRDFQNLPRIMRNLESVRVTGEGRSHWVAKAPAGTTVEWDAEITEDRPNELIAWRSLEGADVDNSGSVRFEPAPGNRGTIVRVEMEYNPPGGALGAAVATLFGKEPGQQAQEALRCFKQVVETGEVVVSEGTVWDNGLLTQRPAQPPSGEELGAARGGGAA
ncbi:MAG: SRPBCC family protein [Acidobacteriota bacterium]|nr:SRPBCC family protein [Acidobacteriota bacterium]